MTYTASYSYQQQLLPTTLPPHIPASPSFKRKREVQLHIPVSPVGSFNSAASINSIGSFEETQPAVVANEDEEGGGGSGGATEEEVVEVPSPRTRVANKLDGLSLGDGGVVRKINELKEWRMKRNGASSQWGGWGNDSDPTEYDRETAVKDDEEEQRREEEEALLSRKKRATKIGFGDLDVADDVPNLQSDNPSTSTTSRPRSKIKNRVGIAADSSPAEIPETPWRSTADEDVQDGMTVLSAQSTSSKRRLRSPPPMRDIEMDEDAHKEKNGEEDEDSETGESGIGYKPTSTQRYARSQKRMQQIREYKAREAREARAKRTERRRRGSARSSTSSLVGVGNSGGGGGIDLANTFDIGDSLEFKRVHFAS